MFLTLFNKNIRLTLLLTGYDYLKIIINILLMLTPL